ncbi:hypothetical protein [Megalodesulfovibrio gigas]|uniref:Antitoxin SocA-like Panacea domain-containing protein n=1 Tax=Megalodesulfovibrio gigas (strain ATCC 19364 / DSM 1382 / NCIMB 9332 / VKM B-1759) TaxID=1121448 RepID=T2GB36_MEGG1|nr:hypothetical protein [Megalodesulfovibrio gigas]AGW13800.1 hypothetical protein DGI_2029 [Megalodesulfovibrio gigas DSM 1382 = ATCC 19364]
MDTIRVDTIIQYALTIASEQDEYRDRELGSIHLIKYLYLADLDYAAMHGGETYTGIPWVFFRFGPWAAEIQERIPVAARAMGAERRTFQTDAYGELERYFAPCHAPRAGLERKLDVIVATSVAHKVKKFGADTDSLLQHVYGTEPLLRAAPREPLDFTLAARPLSDQEQKAAQIKTMTPKQAKKLEAWKKEGRARFQRCLAEKKARESKRITPPPPRFDDVYFAGLAALDEQAGESVPSGGMTCSISPDVWKSPARYDPDLS